ncbi:MAG: methyltransferase domain-containing protein [Planctomycetes bacterium]|nr:methyltransferase domain-containing protein [Planctomycetota bacterium]
MSDTPLLEPTPDRIERIQRMRRGFLDAGASPVALPDYWRDDEDLEVYDAILAQRIGWKWEAVLDDLPTAGDLDEVMTILDWGCGTGVATRRLLRRIRPRRVYLHDRSERAIRFAARRIGEESPEVQVESRADFPGIEPDLLVISHVLNELASADEAELLSAVSQSVRVLWVESGASEVSRRLSRIRDDLLASHLVLSPCPHQGRCGAIASREGHWCHHFARPPAEVFQSEAWALYARRLKIDLRSLPYHHLYLLRKDFATSTPAPGQRIIGRPELGSKEARVHLCDEDGLHQLRVFKGRSPALWKGLKKDLENHRRGPFRREGDRLL